MKHISRIASLGTLIAFLLVIGFFSVFGKSIRDYNSTHVAVMSVTFHLFESDDHSTMALPNGCFKYESIAGKAELFYVEKNADDGEEAFFAVKTTDFEIGRTDGLYTEVSKGDWVNKEFIYKSDRPFSDGDRVVVVEEIELQ